MAATKQDISDWFDRGKIQQSRWMIVVCDCYDYDDYPVYVEETDNFWERYTKYDGKEMQRIMEVYDLSMDRDKQLNQHRVMNTPPKNS